MQTQTFTTPYYPFRTPHRSGSRLRYGLRQESELRRGLSADNKLFVHHSDSEDTIYKMDAIVRFRDAPMLPAVGIQFTTKPDVEKMNRTIRISPEDSGRSFWTPRRFREVNNSNVRLEMSERFDTLL